MAHPRYPADLPLHPEISGLRLQPSGGLVYGPTDAGAGKTRPESTAKPKQLDVPLIFTTDQRERFFRFWDEEIGRGARPFWAPVVETLDWALSDETGALVTDEDGSLVTFEDWRLGIFRADAEPPAFAPRNQIEWGATLPLWILIP